MRCARTGLLTKGQPLALLATAPACPPPAQDGLRVCRGSWHRRAAFRTSRSHRTEPLTKPGDAFAGRCLHARERCRWLGIDLTGNGSPTAIHPACTVTPVPSAAMVTPASTLQDVPVSLDLSPEDCAGVPERLDFTLPGSDDSHHESRVTGCALGIPHGPILQDTASTAQALSSTGGPKIRVEKSSEDSKSP